MNAIELKEREQKKNNNQYDLMQLLLWSFPWILEKYMEKLYCMTKYTTISPA